MYGCPLPEFYLTGSLCKILTGVPCCRALLELWMTLSLNPTGSEENLRVQKRNPGIMSGGIMSKLLRIIAFYRSSTWLELSVESLLESPNAELSINSKLLSISILQVQGKTSGSKRRNPGINIKVTMYSCLLQEFYLTGALRRILTGVPYCRALLKLWITLNLIVFTEVPYCRALLRFWVILISIP